MLITDAYTGYLFIIIFLVSLFLLIKGIQYLVTKKEKKILWAIAFLVVGVCGIVGNYIFAASSTNNIIVKTIINYADSGKEVYSVTEANKLKILSTKDEIYLLNNIVYSGNYYFKFNGNSMNVEYNNMPLQSIICDSFIYKLSGSEERNSKIYINKESLTDILKSKANIENICSNDELNILVKLNH